MFRKNGKKTAMALLVYFLGITVGYLCIYQVEKHQQYSLKDNAIRTAEQIREGKDLEDEFRYLHVNAYLLEGEKITYLGGHVSENYGDDRGYIWKYEAFAKDDKVNYTLLIDLSRNRFLTVAAAPVDKKREIFLFHEIRYMGSILFLFSFLYSILFLLVLLYCHLLHEKNRKVNEIYRCYVANVSHELKSPIASIEAMTETLYTGEAEDEAVRDRYYGMIYGEAKRLEHAVQDILELSRVQEKRLDMSRHCVDAEELFAPVLEKYKVYCEELDIRFVSPEKLDKIPVLWTNTERIRQVLEILLNNAVKFMSEEREGVIELAVQVKRKKVLISVSDNGTGISEQNISHIFERFYKEKSERNKNGTGLGLSIAKEILHGLGEEISVKSDGKSGTTFYISVSRIFLIDRKKKAGKQSRGA